MKSKLRSIGLRPAPSLLLAVIVMILAFYAAKEVFWISRDMHVFRRELEIGLRYDQDMLAFQDIMNQKEIKIYNKNTGATVRIHYSSLTYELYFFVVTAQGKRVLKVVDEYMGMSCYDYGTLQLIGPDCLKGEGCGGFSTEGLKALGTPDLVFEQQGFH